MASKKIWYGFLEAGKKSSAVARDLSIETGEKDTLYLFNLNAGQILRYKASIVESKLRELKPAEEKKFLSELESGFKKARKDFKVSSATTLYAATTKPAPASKSKSKENDDADEEFGFDSDSLDVDPDLLDSDAELIDEEETEPESDSE